MDKFQDIVNFRAFQDSIKFQDSAQAWFTYTYVFVQSTESWRVILV